MIGAFAALFLSVGIFAATTLTEKEQVSGLTLANIEAMTQADDGDTYMPTSLPDRYTCNAMVAIQHGRPYRCKMQITNCNGGGFGCSPSQHSH